MKLPNLIPSITRAIHEAVTHFIKIHQTLFVNLLHLLLYGIVNVNVKSLKSYFDLCTSFENMKCGLKGAWVHVTTTLF